mgnify:CR=1 FL=1
MEEKEVILVGLDINKSVKEIFEKVTSGDFPDKFTDKEREAYQLGAATILDILKQLLDEGIADKEMIDYEFIAVHVPELSIMEEFDSIEEIMKRKAQNMVANK